MKGKREQLLLGGKLTIPASRRDRVSRAELIDRVADAAPRVVSVVAPAGYGKSTFLSEWAMRERRRTAWVSLDSLDDDPAALLTVIAAACAGLSEDVARVAATLAQGDIEPLGRGAPLLAGALRRTTTPFAVFIDDAQKAASPGCEDLLGVLLAAVPEGSVVALSSRRGLRYVARQRVAGHVVDVGVGDLRLDLAGARRIAETAGVDPSDAELQSWVRRCDGWPTGLFLCALIARDGRGLLSGGDREVADYLYRECLLGLPAGLRDFLLRSSVLGQLSVAACNEILETTDSARWLRDLEDRSLFLIPATGGSGGYRYHDLFREFLQTELEATQPGESARLHARAADWHETNGLLPEAVEHSFSAGDKPRAAGLVADAGLVLYQRGEVALLDRWLERLGDDVLERSPWTTVIAAWVALLQGSVPDAIRWTALLERIDAGAAAIDAVALDSQRAMIRAAMRRTPVEAGLADAAFAAAAEPRTSPWRDQALHIHGVLLVLSGESSAAREVFATASRVARAAGNADSVLLSESDLAALSITAGDWGGAERHAEAAIAVVAEQGMDGYGTSTLPYALGARIASHRGDAGASVRYLARAMRARERANHLLPVLAVQARVHMAHTWLARGDQKAARALLVEIDEVLEHDLHLGTLIGEVEALRSRLPFRADDSGTVPMTPAELRLIPFLQTHLTLKEIAVRLAVSRNTVNSQVAAIYRKLGVGTRGAAVGEATRRGLLGS